MTVTFIGVTQPKNLPITTAEDLISYAARVSNPENQNNTKTSAKLLKYLIRESHWSPFEMVHVIMEITTTRDISRQILRHRSFSFQEFSQRYAESTNFTTREVRLQDKKNRQNSIVPTNDQAAMLHLAFERVQSRVLEVSKSAYKDALDMGVAKEQARALLPEGLTETTLYMSGSLRSWIHYVDLRAGNGTQREHMLIAETCKDLLITEFTFLKDYWDPSQ
jgi:thymidylate synthase (FAD)